MRIHLVMEFIIVIEMMYLKQYTSCLIFKKINKLFKKTYAKLYVAGTLKIFENCY